MEFLNAFLTVVLVLVSVFMVLLVLMQRGNAAGGLGAAMGGGMAESALGAETSSVLSRWTRNTAILFFLLTFGLYLSKLYDYEQGKDAAADSLPQFESSESSSSERALQELMAQPQGETEGAPSTPAPVPENQGEAPAAE